MTQISELIFTSIIFYLIHIFHSDKQMKKIDFRENEFNYLPTIKQLWAQTNN